MRNPVVDVVPTAEPGGLFGGSMKRVVFALIAALLLGLLTSESLVAQEALSDIALSSSRTKLNRLGAGHLDDEASILIDGATNISIEVLANVANVDIRITTPNGMTITPQNITAIGGSYLFVAGDLTEDTSVIFSPQLTRNNHYIFSFPAQGVGAYLIHFHAPVGLNHEVPIITEARWDSPIVTKLLVNTAHAVIGRPVVLTQAVFSGATPVNSAKIQASVKQPNGTSVTVNLLDSGDGVTDDKTGDGLFSGEFTPTLPGVHHIVSIATSGGSRIDTSARPLQGPSFYRTSLTQVEVKPIDSQFSGSVTNAGVDDNGDGLFDRIRFRLGVQTFVSGNYKASVQLKTALGQTIIGQGDAVLQEGNGEITANVTAEDILLANENGPYTIESISLDHVTPAQGSIEVDRRFGLGQTLPYQLNQFQKPPLVLTGVFTEQGIDTNGNGKFDILRVSVQVDVLTAGSYQWNMILGNSNSQNISFAPGQGNLVRGLNNITVDFNGAQIRRSESNGPYQIKDLLLFGPQSIVGLTVGNTRDYLYTDFEEGGPNVSIALSPASATNLRVGSAHNLTVTLNQNGAALSSKIVTLRITDGPNAGFISSKTSNASGIASFSYISNAVGTDTMRADVTVDDFLFNSNIATATWTNNAAPTCSLASPSISLITPPDNSMVPIDVVGVTDPDGDLLSISVLGVRQDEPVNHLNWPENTPDAIIQTGRARIKAERIFGTVVVNGTSYTGDGRVYHIAFSASDGNGGTCQGSIKVGVPHVRTATPVDGGSIFDSTIP